MKKVGSEFDHDIQTQNPCQCFFALSIDHSFNKELLLLSQLYWLLYWSFSRSDPDRFFPQLYDDQRQLAIEVKNRQVQEWEREDDER